MSDAALGVHYLGCGVRSADPATAASIGFKAFNLDRLARLGIPVPPAFVLGTAHCATYFAAGGHLSIETMNQLDSGMHELQNACRLAFGSPRAPLLVSVRSGAPVSMPGMMDTVLNVGLCDATMPGLLRLTGNPRLAWDSYRRLVQSYAEVVKGVPAAVFAVQTRDELTSRGVAGLEQLDFRGLRSLLQRFLEAYAECVGEPFPQSPDEQLEGAVAAVFASWNNGRARAYRKTHGIPDTLGTAVAVQRMVFGNAGGTSGAGVAFTRDPATGENRLYLDFAFNAQGEDVVGGRTVPGRGLDLRERLPDVHTALDDCKERLEQEFREPQEFEFTVQDGELFLLQTRAAKRTALAALRIAVEGLESGWLTRDDARAQLLGVNLESIEIMRVEGAQGSRPIARGVGASVGVAAGRIAFDPARAEERANRGEPVLLLRTDISTSDIPALPVVLGILTSHGGRTSHAAVIARQMNKACIVGCADMVIDDSARACRIGGQTFAEGDALCLDAAEGAVYAGMPEIARERPTELLERLHRYLPEAGEPSISA